MLAHLDDCLVCQTVVASLVQGTTHHSTQKQPITLRPQTLETASVVADRYEITQILGWGGMGEVYLANDRQLNESVALKTLSIFKVDAPELAMRLRGEAQLARKVTHPNVVRIFDFGTHRVHERDGETLLPFLTMELLNGQTLGNRIRTEGPCPLATGIPIAIDILMGLGAVHAAGIIHRDLKPDNVFLTTQGSGEAPRTVLTDLRDL
jgi:eukaryotic-like serine/threonine-protein kinase